MKFVSKRLDMYYQNIFIKIRKFYHFFKKVIVSDDAESITNRSHYTHDSKRTCTTRTIERKTFREHRCGAGQTLSEGQVRILLTTLEC